MVVLLFVTCTVREHSREFYVICTRCRLVSHTRPPCGRSGNIAYADVCPRQDPVLANQIHLLLYDVSLKFRDIALVCSKDIAGMCCNFALIHSQNRARTSHTGKTMQIRALHTSLAALAL